MIRAWLLKHGLVRPRQGEPGYQCMACRFAAYADSEGLGKGVKVTKCGCVL